MLERFKKFYHENEPVCTVAFFVAGFLFDTVAVGRIDKLHNIIHQASYLSLCALFTTLELRERHGRFAPSERFKTAWRYHMGATHFMLGTLLNIYTLFFFKSASMGTSFIFLLILAILLAVNELKPFESSGTLLRMSLFSLCLVSYFTYLIPTLMGRLGTIPFLGSLIGASLCIAALTWRLDVSMPDQKESIRKHVVYPFAAVAVLFAVLYFSKIIPPVPLSLSEIGVYHEVRREGARFALSSTRPRWKFWQRGDQTFLARPGDAIYCWISVFSPTNFRERLEVHWRFREPDGWGEPEKIPLPITGGRDAGWRGFTVKAKHRPGRWRVEVVTSDGRELGRIHLTVLEDLLVLPRETRIIWR